jgi:ribosomal protein L7Ae-like RNA K-turn-binding protein
MPDKSKKAQAIVNKIDNATGDDAIKAGIKEAVEYLESKKKHQIANEIKKKTKGFAF